MTRKPLWNLDGFLAELDCFYEREPELPEVFRTPVLSWIMSRMDDPYADATRPSDLGGNWWFAWVPYTYHHDTSRVITCTYQIFEGENKVVCRSYGWLSTPI